MGFQEGVHLAANVGQGGLVFGMEDGAGDELAHFVEVVGGEAACGGWSSCSP